MRKLRKTEGWHGIRDWPTFIKLFARNEKCSIKSNFQFKKKSKVHSVDILVLKEGQKNWSEKVKFQGITGDRRLDACFYYFGRWLKIEFLYK